jgi:hypothetical protein
MKRVLLIGAVMTAILGAASLPAAAQPDFAYGGYHEGWRGGYGGWGNHERWAERARWERHRYWQERRRWEERHGWDRGYRGRTSLYFGF